MGAATGYRGNSRTPPHSLGDNHHSNAWERVGGKQIDFPNGKEIAPTFVTFLNYIFFFFYLTLLNILLGTNGTNETYYIPHQRSEIINRNIAR